MAAINVTYVSVLNNPAPFLSPLLFEINYECLYDLPDDLEWKVTYVGSSEDASYDQALETIYVGPVTVGQYQFQLEAPAPNPALIPSEEIVGVTALLLTCSYNGQEFIRVGYFVNNHYADPEENDNPPAVPEPARLLRSVMHDKPRVTKFPIDFGKGLPEGTAMPTDNQGAEMGEGEAGDAIRSSQDMPLYAPSSALQQQHYSPGSDQEAFTHEGRAAPPPAQMMEDDAAMA